MGRGRSASLREALGTDYGVYEAFAAAYRKHDTPLGLNWLAWNLMRAPIGEAKVAVTLRYAEREGLVARDRTPAPSAFCKDGQAAWTATEKLLAMFPEDGPAVLPSDVVHEHGGVRILADSGEDAASWDTDPRYTRLGTPEGAEALKRTLREIRGEPLVDGKKPWIESGDEEV